MTVQSLRQFLAYTEDVISDIKYRRDRLTKDLAETELALAEREKQAHDLRKEIERMERKLT
ncbi:hypothetical protein HYI36_20160 [Bacillus sp. Gen3]|nr:hypothetical protein [Bacillus sp. Gen3]